MKKIIVRSIAPLLIVLTPVLSTTGIASASKTPSIRTVKNLVLNLFYGQQQAAQKSWNAVVDYNFTHDYPGSYGRSAFFAQAAKDAAKYCTGSTNPDFTTLTPVSKWVAPTSRGGGWLFGGKTPKGYTYIVSGTSTCASGIGTPQNTLMHVTILNNKAYFYFSD